MTEMTEIDEKKENYINNNNNINNDDDDNNDKFNKNNRKNNKKNLKTDKNINNSKVEQKNIAEIDFKEPRILICVGRKYSGKSNTIKNFIYDLAINKKILKFGVVFTRTKFDDDYDYVPDNYVVQGFDATVFSRLLENLEKIKKDNGKIPPNFIIFDDLVGVLKDNEIFINFICNHRHYNTYVFLAAQYLNRGVSTTLRECVNYAIMYNSKTKRTLVAFFENFGLFFEKQKEFNDFFQAVTKEPFTALLYKAFELEKEDSYARFKSKDMSKVKFKLDF